MPLDSIAQLTINLRQAPVALANFGIPMVAAILTAPQDAAWDAAYGATVDVIEVTPSDYLATLLALGVTSSEDLHVCLTDLFGQVRQPALVLVGRRATPVAQVEHVDVTGTDDGNYIVTINGNDYTFIASSSTATQIKDGLIAAVDADPDVDADTVDTDTLSVTALTAGVPFTISVTAPNNNLTVTNQTASVGLIEDITTWQAERDDWYALLETTRDAGVQRTTAPIIETLRKIFVIQTSDANAQTSATTDIGYLLGPLGQNLDRTSVWWSQNDDQFVDAAIVGKMMPTDPGSETWFGQSLGSVIGTVPTSETNLQAKNYSYLESFTALNSSMTRGGSMGSGQWIDIIRGRDWLYNLIQVRLYELLRDAPKVPYTDEGGALIGSVIEAALLEAATAGLVDASTIVVTVPAAASQSTTDKGNRYFPNVTFAATLTGAIHSLEITGDLAP